MTQSTAPVLAALPGIVLAGGRSLRMGNDKAVALLGGKPLLHRVVDRLALQTTGVSVNSNVGETLNLSPGTAVFPDTIEGYVGPMAGVLAAMRRIEGHMPAATHFVTVPTDTPFFPLDLAARLNAALTRPGQIAVASSAETLHPVFALWPVALADDLEEWLRTDDKRRVRSFIERHPFQIVDFPMAVISGLSTDPFFNINTPIDLEIAEHWLPHVEEFER